MTEDPTLRIDATGLLCPLPVLKARKALQGLAPGDICEVRTTDPAALKDFPAFCAATGHHLLTVSEDRNGARFVIRKGG